MLIGGYIYPMVPNTWVPFYPNWLIPISWLGKPLSYGTKHLGATLPQLVDTYMLIGGYIYPMVPNTLVLFYPNWWIPICWLGDTFILWYQTLGCYSTPIGGYLYPDWGIHLSYGTKHLGAILPQLVDTYILIGETFILWYQTLGCYSTPIGRYLYPDWVHLFKPVRFKKSNNFDFCKSIPETNIVWLYAHILETGQKIAVLSNYLCVKLKMLSNIPSNISHKK